jgi:hypothetical protein
VTEFNPCWMSIFIRNRRWVDLIGLISIRKNRLGFLSISLKILSGHCYGKNEKFANFYPDLGMASKGTFRGPDLTQSKYLP